MPDDGRHGRHDGIRLDAGHDGDQRPIGLAFVALLIVGVVVGIRWLATSGKTPGGASPPDRALTLAREQYAKGEISREEFERLRLDLS
jgi:putative membrane protein